MSAPESLARVARTPESDTGLHEEAANDAADGLIARLGRLWERGRLPSESEVRRLFEARLTDVAANKLARRWVELYSAAAGKERRLMLSALAQVRATYAGDGGEGVRFFKRLNAQSQGLRFLVDLRADMLRWRKQVAGLQGLDKELEGLLSAWFDVGLLELRPLTWDSPASLLEKLILYEAVHEITSWDDLRHRVAPDRRCYAYFHPQMPGVPLIFVEVAFAGQMAGNVQALLDSSAPPQDLDKARWAIFYSISNTQPGLKASASAISCSSAWSSNCCRNCPSSSPSPRCRRSPVSRTGWASWTPRRCRASCAMARDASATAAMTASAGSRTCRARPRARRRRRCGAPASDWRRTTCNP